jgi:hypothetical protein
MAKLRQERVSQREYAKRLGVSNTAVGNAIEDGKIHKGWDKVEKRIIVPIADKEWGNLHKKSTIEAIKTEVPSGSKESTPKLNAQTPYQEAVRLEKVAKARLAFLELQREEGKLINKGEVQKSLYAYGTEVRKSIQQIPERCVDKVRAAGNRNDAIQLMQDVIDDLLKRLTAITEHGLDNVN